MVTSGFDDDGPSDPLNPWSGSGSWEDTTDDRSEPDDWSSEQTDPLEAGTPPGGPGGRAKSRSPRQLPPRGTLRSVGGATIVGVVALLLVLRGLSGDGDTGDRTDWALLTRSVVYVEAPDCGWGGSGTIVLDGGHVLTNAHVALTETGGLCELEIYAAESPNEDPEWIASARIVEEGIDTEHDLAVIRLVDRQGRPTTAAGRAPVRIGDRELELGEEIKVLGFPGMGGIKITITPGEQSGWWSGSGGDWAGDFYKTSAKMGPGVSGGAAFSAVTGDFVGVPTGGSSSVEGEGEGDILGLIRPNRYIIPLLDRAERADN